MAKKTEKVSFERETRVLLEDMNGRIKTIAEQYGTTVNRFDTIDAKLDKIDDTLQRHEAKLYKLEWGVETLNNRVGIIDTKVDRIENELETVKQATLENSRDIKELKELHKLESSH